MKPFFGIDLTTNKKNDKFNGEEFLVAKSSPDLLERFETASEEAEETFEKSRLPKPLRLFQWLCGTGGLVILFGILRAVADEEDFSLKQAYENASWLFLLAGACLLAWVLLSLFANYKSKTVLEADESNKTFSDLDKISEAIFADMKVPETSKEVDILIFFYKIKNGEIKVCEKGMQYAKYLNPIFNVFCDQENLYLANLEGKYAFPLSSIKRVSTVKKKIVIASWNKDVSFKDDIYKPYKLTDDNYGAIHCKQYHIIEIEKDGEIFGIYFPSYELPAFKEVLGTEVDFAEA